MPRTLDELADHDVVEVPGAEGRARIWTFTQADIDREVQVAPRVTVNDALTVHRLILNGAGVGMISRYLAAPEIDAGRLTQLLPDWEPATMSVSLVFPSRRELAPTVRAFVDFMKEVNVTQRIWQDNSPDRS